MYPGKTFCRVVALKRAGLKSRKHLKLEQEKGKGQEMVLNRNVPELKLVLRHIKAEQWKGENHQEWDR